MTQTLLPTAHHIMPPTARMLVTGSRAWPSPSLSSRRSEPLLASHTTTVPMAPSQTSSPPGANSIQRTHRFTNMSSFTDPCLLSTTTFVIGPPPTEDDPEEEEDKEDPAEIVFVLFKEDV